MQTQEVLENSKSPSEGEFDLKLFINFLLRNKMFIGIVSVSFFFLSYLYSLTLKRVWEGQFQIVLTSEDSNLSNISPLVKRFVSNKRGNDLTTQVGILKSRSVLMPIFDYVNSEKEKNQKGLEFSFLRWKKKLNIELEEGSSILNISYRDTYKDLIIPALNKMSSRYQEYSGEKEKREQELTKDYLLNQVEKYRKKSFESLKSVQEYAIDQDLIFFQGGFSDGSMLSNRGIGRNFSNNLVNNLDIAENFDSTGSNLILPNTQIESVRVRAANEIRNIDSQLKKIKEIKNAQDIQYLASSIPSIKNEQFSNQLAQIDNELIYKRGLYKEEDISIKKLLQQKNTIIKLYREALNGHLKAKKTRAEATLEATSRPKEVLIKYKELIREASRDENTLVLLENRLRDIKLSLAKRSDPWELISEPILLKKPVAPSRRNISIVGFFIGFIIGSFIASYREKIKLN